MAHESLNLPCTFLIGLTWIHCESESSWVEFESESIRPESESTALESESTRVESESRLSLDSDSPTESPSPSQESLQHCHFHQLHQIYKCIRFMYANTRSGDCFLCSWYHIHVWLYARLLYLCPKEMHQVCGYIIQATAITIFQKLSTERLMTLNDHFVIFDPTFDEFNCVTLPRVHCVRIP